MVMSAFLVYILKVALLTAVFVLLYHLLLRRETFHRTARIVLVSSLIISYILPFCVITIHRPAPVVENPEVAAIQAPAAVLSTPTRHTVQPDIQPGERQIRQEQNQIQESAGTDRLETGSRNGFTCLFDMKDRDAFFPVRLTLHQFVKQY